VTAYFGGYLPLAGYRPLPFGFFAASSAAILAASSSAKR